MDNYEDIVLQHSTQMDELTTAHLAQLKAHLQDKEHLRHALCLSQQTVKQKDEEIRRKDTIIASKDAIIEQKDQQIAQLLQRIADLEKPTTVTSIAGDYIGQMQVNTMNISTSIPSSPLPQYRKRKSKITSADILQLPLWQTS